MNTVTPPIVYGTRLYLSTDGGLLTCLDARTGERHLFAVR